MAESEEWLVLGSRTAVEQELKRVDDALGLTYGEDHPWKTLTAVEVIDHPDNGSACACFHSNWGMDNAPEPTDRGKNLKTEDMEVFITIGKPLKTITEVRALGFIV